MSEAAPERTARPPAAKAGGNFFTKKYGPLPGWGWIALGATGGAVFIWYRNRKAASTAAASTAADTAAADSTAAGSAPGADSAAIQSEVEQLQGTVSEQEQDIGQEAGQEKKDVAAENKTNARQGKKIVGLQQEEKNEPKPKPAPKPRPKPAPRPRPGGTGGGPPRRRKPPARKRT